MNDRPDDEHPLEDRLHSLLAERGQTSDDDMRRLVDGLAGMPSRRTPRRWSVPAAVAAVALLIGAATFLVGRLAVPGVAGPLPPDPAAFDGDPRLAACRTQLIDVDRAFEMTHAEWVPLYFPGWWKGAPELEVDDPALVVLESQRQWGVAGAPAAEPTGGGSPGPIPTQSPSFRMCIAVGPPDNFVMHQYGPTWFDLIVPVLSDADFARAAHLDPDVLGDPAAWPFPDRLAACGGLTANVQYVFEANPLRDFARYFPNTTSVPALDLDEPGIVIVYRDPIAIYRLAGWTADPNNHDVCVVFEEIGPHAGTAIIPDVDTRGFHLRIDGPAPANPPSTASPAESPSSVATTPEPAPAWAGDAGLSLECDGPPSTIGPTGRMDIGSSVYSPDATLSDFLEFAKNSALTFPTAGFRQADRATGARLYTHVVGGKVKAVIVANSEGGDELGRWFVGSVASCDPSEFDTTRDFGQTVTIWTDASGRAVSTSVVYERGDCYGATKLTVGGHLFVRDPTGSGYDSAALEETYDGDATLPATAIRQPYTDGERRLYLARDGRAAFVVSGTSVERWPRVTNDEYTRIDCN